MKTLDYIDKKSDSQPHSPNTQSYEHQIQNTIPNFGVKADVQSLIEKYAPTTATVEKKVNFKGSRYKCYDTSGNCLGRVKGKLGDRYWQDSLGNKYY